LRYVPLRYAPTAKAIRTATAIPSFGVKILRQILLPIGITTLKAVQDLALLRALLCLPL
jgi:hypothetical protein